MRHCFAGMLNKVKEKTIVCLDGDGSVLMHMGSLQHWQISKQKIFSYYIQQFAHESVAGNNNIQHARYEKLYSALGYKSN